MKILAATPKQYSPTNYIVSLDANELACLTALGYGEITVTDEQGSKIKRNINNLVSGDVIDPEISRDTLDCIRSLRDNASNIKKYIKGLRTSITKVENLIPEIEN